MQNTVEEFKKSGFIVIRNLVDVSETSRLYDYTLQQVERGNMDDGQVPGSPSFYLDSEVNALQKKLTPVIEAAIQKKLLSVFCYNRIYRTGAVLRAHKDSSRAEISATINLGQQGNPWDLWLVDHEENAQNITLLPGDGLIYYGSKLMHWRGKLVESDFVSQVMFHYVDGHGKHAFTAKAEVIRRVRRYCRKLMGLAY